MLKPNKHTSLEMSVLNVSSQILELLKKNRIIEYNVLFEKLSQNIDSEAKRISMKVIFSPAVNLLYLLGLLEYQYKSDSFKYMGSYGNN